MLGFCNYFANASQNVTSEGNICIVSSVIVAIKEIIIIVRNIYQLSRRCFLSLELLRKINIPHCVMLSRQFWI